MTFRQALVATLFLVAAPRAQAAAPGTMYLLDHQVDTSSASFEKDAKKSSVSTLKKQGDTWKLYFVAWLKHSPGAMPLNLVFYDTADKGKDPINAFPLTTQANARIMVSSIEVGPDQGFKPGHKYDVRIARLVEEHGHEHEDVFARASVELK